MIYFQGYFSHLEFIYKNVNKRAENCVFIMIKGLEIFSFSHRAFIEGHVRLKASFEPRNANEN